MTDDMKRITAEIDMLTATAIEIATDHLTKSGSFFPFGLSIAADHEDDDDEIDLLEASSEEGEINEEEAVDGLVEHFGDNRDDFRAVAVVFDAEMDDEWDAITVLIAHAGAEPIDVQAP